MQLGQMFQAMQKAAKDVEECKEMLQGVQRQLDRMEEEQGKMVRGFLLEKEEKKDESMRDGGEDETGKKTSNIKKFEENSSEDSSPVRYIDIEYRLSIY